MPLSQAALLYRKVKYKSLQVDRNTLQRLEIGIFWKPLPMASSRGFDLCYCVWDWVKTNMKIEPNPAVQSIRKTTTLRYELIASKGREQSLHYIP